MDNETHRYLSDLEYRLDKHLEALNEAVEQRDNLALDAAWGIVTASYMIGSLVLAGMVDKWLGLPWFFGFIVYVLVFGAALVIGGNYVEKGRQGDKDKLYRLPKWQRGDPEG